MKHLSINHFSGCLIGGAIGDALGAPVEFEDLETILQEHGESGILDYVEFPDGRGEITDDTQMLLFTAEGLLRAGREALHAGHSDAVIQSCFEAYRRWLYTQEGEEYEDWPDDILNGLLIAERSLFVRRYPGNTCLNALRTNIAGTLSSPLNDSKGCGGIMRIAPVGLLFHNSPEKAFRMGADLSAITHGHPSGYLPSGMLASILAYLIKGEDLMAAIQQTIPILRTYDHHEETEQAINAAIALHAEGSPSFEKVETLGGGWVAEEALSISLYVALHYPHDFEKAINLAVTHSGDSDSTGSITGNIVGLMLGMEALPSKWLSNLTSVNLLKQVAKDLHEMVWQ